MFCETDTGEKIIVEMQNRSQPYFKERTLYYASEAIVRQGESGSDWDYKVTAVYLVSFMNFRLKDDSNDVRIDAGLTDLKTGELFSDKLRLIYLQLPCFNKEAAGCETDFERWIYVLKNMDILQRIPWAAQNAVFQRLAEIGEVSAMTKEERIKYDHALKAYRDTLNQYRGAIQEGLEKGMAEGLAQGRAEGLLEVARKMKAKGKSVEEIAEMTSLTIDEIERL